MKDFIRVLAIDLGASSGRGIVFERKGGQISEKTVHRFPNGAVEKDGGLYWDLSMLFEEICAAIRLADASCGKLDAVGIDTWGVDVGFIGKDGKPIGDPRHYRDPSHARTRRSLPDRAWEFYKISGISDNDFNTTYQLIARAREGFDFANVKHILFMPQLLGYMLTGVAAVEPTIASTSGFFRRDTGFCKEFLREVGIYESLFPKVVNTSDIIGNLSKEARKKIGINYDLPVVAAAGHDTACAVHTLSGKEPNPLFLSSGTWSLFGTVEDKPIIAKQTFESGYTNELAVGGKVRFLRNIMGMWIIQECRRQWADGGEELSYPEIVDLARNAVDKGAIIDVDGFSAPGAMADRVREYVWQKQGIALESKGEIALCVYKSLAKAYKDAYDALKRITGREYRTLYVLGGGANNGFLNSLIEEELGIKVEVGASEASALGNALCCMTVADKQ